MSKASDATVAVITATIGHRSLERAIRSVREQTHQRVQHLVVIDGPEFAAAVAPSLRAAERSGAKPAVTVLAYRTGMDGWCSHRIYAAAPFLVSADFVCFLDQDNWFDAEHIEQLLAASSKSGVPAAYALRKIYGQDGVLVCNDDCQSLGPLHDTYERPGLQHIDSNCWLLQREFATSLAHEWCMPYYGDRRFAHAVIGRCPEIPCTRAYSVNYTAESRAESAPIDFFLQGNAIMQQRYPGGLPWHRASENEPKVAATRSEQAP